MVSIKDVAAYAHVSTATVSAVINGVNVVKPSTRERILESIEKLGYIPNQSARGLASHKTYSIGILCTFYPDSVIHPERQDYMRELFFSTYIYGILECMGSKGYSFNIEYFSAIDAGNDLPSLVTQHRLDGLFVLGSLYDDDFIKKLQKYVNPVVVIGKDCAFADHVKGNYRNSIEIGVQYLIKHGHKRIAYACCDSMTGAFIQKLDGYSSAMQNAGLHANEDWIFPSRQIVEDGYHIGENLLAFSPKTAPTAIVCACDTVAAGIYRCYLDNNRCIPDDLSIIGYENLSFDEYVTPPLTSIDFHKSEMIFYGCKMMDERMHNPQLPIREITVNYSLKERSSVKIMDS